MDHRTIFTFAAYLLLIISFTTSFAQNSGKPDSSAPEVVSERGLVKVTFSAPEGRIKVYLPDDIAAGDTISGTVSVEPGGKTEQERLANQDVLNGTVIDLGDGTNIAANKPKFTWTPLMASAVGVTKYLLKLTPVYPNATMPSSAANVSIASITPPAATNFTLPALGQAGRPLTITGPFDGNTSTTECSIGGKTAEVIAESRRKAVVASPANVIGPSTISLNEQGTTTSADFRNLGISLSSPKTNLMKEEKTEVKVQVNGLRGITEWVPVQITTTGTANMAGGNVQNIQIKPNQVRPDGTFAQTFALTGTSAGGFNVTGTVMTGGSTTGDNKCNCVCEFANPPIVPSGASTSTSNGHYSWKPNMKSAGCTGSHCTVKSTEYAWSIGTTSTATYTVVGGKTGQELSVDVTGDGTMVLTVTVTVTCSDGTTCTATKTKEFTVKK